MGITLQTAPELTYTKRRAPNCATKRFQLQSHYEMGLGTKFPKGSLAGPSGQHGFYQIRRLLLQKAQIKSRIAAASKEDGPAGARKAFVNKLWERIGVSLAGRLS